MTIAEIYEQACRIYDRHEVFRAHLEGRQIFPLRLSIKSITSGDFIKNFSLYREQFAQLQQDCQTHRLSLEYSSVKNRQLGDQLLPREVVFPTEDIFLAFIAKTDEHQRRIKTANDLEREKKCFTIQFHEALFAKAVTRLVQAYALSGPYGK